MSGSLEAAPAEFADELILQAVRAGADAAQVTATRQTYFEIDFSECGIDLLRSITNSSASITIFRDGKRGSASVNGCKADDIDVALSAAQIAADAGIKDPANGIAESPLLPEGEYGHKEPQRDAMIASAEGFIEELGQRYPAIRTRNSIYSFSDFEKSFANSLGVRQRERRGKYGFGAGFCGKDGRRTTSVNYSSAASFEAFERLLGVGTVQRLIDETLRSFERKPVPEKFVGDVIITPDCLRSLMGSITNALSGSALFAGTTPHKGRKGEQIASDKFSLLNRPRSRDFPGGTDFDGYGIPTHARRRMLKFPPALQGGQGRTPRLRSASRGPKHKVGRGDKADRASCRRSGPGADARAAPGTDWTVVSAAFRARFSAHRWAWMV